MIPQPNDHVKLIFKTGLVEEGIVVSWSEKSSVLRSMHNNNILIIQNTQENIVAIKLFNERPVRQTERPEKSVYVEMPKPEEYTPDENLRTKKLVELHGLKKAEEARRARDLLTSFESSGLTKPITYGIPAKLPDIDFNNTRKKANQRNK